MYMPDCIYFFHIKIIHHYDLNTLITKSFTSGMSTAITQSIAWDLQLDIWKNTYSFKDKKKTNKGSLSALRMVEHI